MYPDNLRYTREHEWIRQDNGDCTVGITDHAAEQLGDVTFVELPNVGTKVTQSAEVATVESVKAASDVYAPIAGTVSAVNESLNETPELVNESPYEDGWFFKLSDVDATQLDGLMDAKAYEQFVKEQEH